MKRPFTGVRALGQLASFFRAGRSEWNICRGIHGDGWETCSSIRTTPKAESYRRRPASPRR